MRFVAAAFAQIESSLGPVDVLVNNAGFSGFPILETTSPEDWKMLVDGNLTSAYACVYAVLKSIKARRDGVIVNIGSVNAPQALGDPANSAARGRVPFSCSAAPSAQKSRVFALAQVAPFAGQVKGACGDTKSAFGRLRR